MGEGSKTFIEITNEDIYEKLCKIEDRVKETNGKVKLNRWMASTALALCLTLFGIMATQL